MRGLIATFLLMLAIAVMPTSVWAAKDSPPAASLDYLAKWEGQYPSMDRKTFQNYPKGQSFWEDANVLAMMKKNIPTEIIVRVVGGWDGNPSNVETPFVREGKLLSVMVCKPHFCSSNAARFFFNLENKTVQLCWSELNEKTKKQTDFWIDDKIRRLGPGGCMQRPGLDLFKAVGNPKY